MARIVAVACEPWYIETLTKETASIAVLDDRTNTTGKECIFRGKPSSIDWYLLRLMVNGGLFFSGMGGGSSIDCLLPSLPPL
jgi:hypothetical protein